MVAKKDQELKAFFLFVDGEKLAPKLAELADKQKYEDVALAWVPKSDHSIEAYKVSLGSDVKNMVILYKNKRVQSKFVNIKADDKKAMDEFKAAIAELVK